MDWGDSHVSPPKWRQTATTAFRCVFWSRPATGDFLIYQESLVLYNKTFYYQLYQRTTKYCFFYTVLTDTNREKHEIVLQLYQRTTKYCFYCTVLITTNHKSGNRQNLRNYHFLPTNCLHNLPHNLPNLRNYHFLPTIYRNIHITCLLT